MGNRPPITAVVITLNEEHNIARCVRSLAWADEILVVDSGSRDRTCQLATENGAKVVQHAWEGYGQQKNWAMGQARHDWVLFVDADEEVSPGLKVEVEDFLACGGEIDNITYLGASIPRRTWYLGRWIMHGGWYPNRLVRLCHRPASEWSEPAVHESLFVKGSIRLMKADLYHYTFRDVGEQVMTNIRFARLGAAVAKRRGQTGSLFRILTKPVFKFLETYVWKRGFLDGFPGFVISVNAAHSIFMKYVELRLEKNSDQKNSADR
jgi:glycosyltransferase involved in cell wall biosynthesis